MVVGMIGNIRAWKGQDTLIRALDRVRRVVSVDGACLRRRHSRLPIASTSTRCARWWRQLGLQRHVIFTGYQQHVADFLTCSTSSSTPRCCPSRSGA